MFKEYKRYSCILFLIISCFNNSFGQDSLLTPIQSARQYIESRGETIIRFARPDHLSISEISRNLSVDNYVNDTITAYASDHAFAWFKALNIPFTVVPPPSLSKDVFNMVSEKFRESLSYYPSYFEYITLMSSFESEYSGICILQEFGYSVDGRKLLALKISDNPGEKENEPVVFYTATMHGDEPLGYIIMLNLIRYLLDQYHINHEIKALVDQTEIWINPLANPDGAFFISDSTITGSVRFNKNHIDLNRDFPLIPFDPKGTADRQPETSHMMSLMEDIHPVLAANFHSGAEVVNYPWDSRHTNHPDYSWYRWISRAYADTAHARSPDGYMDFMNNGITRGFDWYPVEGGRMDYMNYYLNSREVTIELSDNKIPAEDMIDDFWNYNRESLIQFISRAHTGFKGTVIDSASGNPVRARIWINSHDIVNDNSFVFSGMDNGSYFRLIEEGTYRVIIGAPGYKYKTATVNVNEGQLTELNMKLSPDFSLRLFPNPFNNELRLNIPYSGFILNLTFIDLSGRKVMVIRKPVKNSGEQIIETDGINPGYYIIQISYNQQTWQFKGIKLNR